VLTIGNNVVRDSGYSSGTDCIILGIRDDGGGMASGAGTITSVTADLQTTASIAFVAVTVDGTFVVRSIGSTITPSVGVSTYSTSLSVQAGDYLGVWIGGSSNGVGLTATDHSSAYAFAGLSTKPTAGQDITANFSGTTSDVITAIYGTG
jgi:hypothetical protein